MRSGTNVSYLTLIGAHVRGVWKYLLLGIEISLQRRILQKFSLLRNMEVIFYMMLKIPLATKAEQWPLNRDLFIFDL